MTFFPNKSSSHFLFILRVSFLKFVSITFILRGFYQIKKNEQVFLNLPIFIRFKKNKKIFLLKIIYLLIFLN